MLLLRQTFNILALQMPHLSLFFVAHISRFNADPRRAACRLPVGVDGLLTGITAFHF